MEIAVLSDIHGNYVALERCVEYALLHGIGTFIFLGDYIGELAYPERTMQILYDLDDRYECYFIKGNKEDYWSNYRIEGERGWKDKDSTTGSLLYAYKLLNARDMDFFEKLQSVMELKLKGLPAITLCHGSPYNNNHDVGRVILDMHEEKLDEHAPYWSKITEHILRGGNTSHGTVLSRAMELCREETGKCVWPDIPEEFWEQAVNEIKY